MATALTTTITSACRSAKHKFTDNVFTSNILLDRLWKNRWMTSGGDKMEFPTRFSTGSTAAARNQGSEFTFAETDTIKSPALDWVYYGVTGKVPFEKQYMASGTNRVLELLSAELERMQKELANLIGGHIYSGTGAESPANITGLTTINSTTNTYAGINRAGTGMSEWQGNAASSQASLTHVELEVGINACTHNGKGPNTIVTTMAVKSLMKAAWAASYQRYNQPPKPGQTGAYASIMFGDFDFMGLPVIADEQCPSGEVHIIRDEYLKFAVPVGADQFEIETFDHESGYGGVKLRCAPMLQLVCTAPKFFYRFTNVAACATS